MTGDLFRSARDYHAAIAHYCHAQNSGESVEDAAQRVVAASLSYRNALDPLIAAATPGSRDKRIGVRRLATLRSLLDSTSRAYNLRARARDLHP